VNCGRPAAADAVAAANPVIVVEVVAPSTEHVDLADNYFRVPTIQHYLIVRARRREVIHHSRSGDAMTIRVINAGRIVLDPPGIAVEPADMYPT
jgi:Uma2 family endonuclease